MAESTEGENPPEDPEAGSGGSPSWSVRDGLEPLERALLDAWRGGGEALVRVRTDAGDDETFPATLLLREPDALLPLDRAAVARARGRVLDVGAGAGAVALALQEAGHEVTALEILPGALEVMRARGVADARRGDVWRFHDARPFDTVLALMNGAALAGTLERLPPFLGRLAALLAPEGQILLDSTDPGEEPREDGREAGELQYQLEYDGRAGPPFPQLFVGPRALAGAAERAGLGCEVVAEDGEAGYLARLVPGG